MNISSLYPIMKTRDMNSAVEFFSSLGMILKHDVCYEDLRVCIMENAAGNRVDICTYPDCIPGFMGFRVNTDNFEEAENYFSSIGCTSSTLAYENRSCIMTIYRSPIGMDFVLIHHKKN